MGTTDYQHLIKEIKHLFMTYRNGIVSDTLRKAGIKYNVIFGLQLPQLSEIANKIKTRLNPEQTETLAEKLWGEKSVRESRLLACWLFNSSNMSEKTALSLAEDVQTREEADILCFRLLHKLPYAENLASKLKDNNSHLVAYCGEALARNLS